jgi:hypothetical protein
VDLPLLCACRERRHGYRAAQQRDELAPLHCASDRLRNS